jgi:DNA-binding response OmpR family regulator
MIKIMICDDEINIREILNKYAKYQGYDTVLANNGVMAVELFKKEKVDLIIMDIMMPEMDGFVACEKIKEIDDNVPFIFLSALGEEYDRIHGFNLGVDDYVVKPFSPNELMLRVKAILKRYKITDQKKLIFNELVINLEARIVTIKGEHLTLSPKEYDLLVYLSTNENVALTRDKILQNVWGYDFFGDDRTLDTHIKLLRKNLGEYNKCIVTLRGVGYRFENIE